jgi:hypothetical protein
MNINVDWSSVHESSTFFNDLVVNFLVQVANLGRQSGWTRLLALPVGMSLTVLELNKSIAHIGEAIIKGLANLIGSSYSYDFKFYRGVVMLCGDTSAGAMVGMINCLASLTYRVAAVLLYPNHSFTHSSFLPKPEFFIGII